MTHYKVTDRNGTFFTCHATDEEEALDLWAGFRSGYETFSEMSRSKLFQKAGCCDVTVDTLAS